METLKEKFAKKALPMAEEVKAFIKQYGDVQIGTVNVSQVYGGMKGVPGMVTETSKLDPAEGIRFRGYSIPELREKLPKAPGGNEPLPEGIFYLMLLGDLPTEEEVQNVSNNWARRAIVPKSCVWSIRSTTSTDTSYDTVQHSYPCNENGRNLSSGI